KYFFGKAKKFKIKKLFAPFFGRKKSGDNVEKSKQAVVNYVLLITKWMVWKHRNEVKFDKVECINSHQLWLRLSRRIEKETNPMLLDISPKMYNFLPQCVMVSQ
ncbi:hypothetical protein, partial [Acinetobacter baumannii]|uniref:hypothetical protein n=1 Tax=Acinetobacter baumannii TaxID=470 RepID=UPI001C071C73